MIHFILIIGLFLLAIGVTMLIRAVTAPAGPSTETIEQIGAYGFAGALPGSAAGDGPSMRTRLGEMTAGIGRGLVRRFDRFKGRDYRSRLIAAGMYTTTPERLLGTQFLCAVGAAFLWFLLGFAGGMSGLLVVLGGCAAVVFGWMLPGFIVNTRARKRREQVERTLPDLIDLLVVTLEAGLSFPQSLRLAATKIKDPLASEVRLTLQEQNMGLTLVEALENLLQRVDTSGVRMFVRSIAQGETMGVSTGQIMRNLALEMRKRQRAYAEERAQKAPIKILFPILFLIMPSLFIVILMPVMIRIFETLESDVRRVPNLTLRREDGRVVAESVVVADSTFRRLRGLLGRGDLPSGHGVLLRPAWSIHTAFMRFPIDVVFLDPDQVVIKIVPNLTPFKTASCRGAREIIELRAGECERRGLALGDRVAWAARAADETPQRAVGVELEPERRGAVVLASGDQRYLKLVRFLLDGKGIEVVASVPPQGVADAVGGEQADVAVIDADAVGEGLRLANVTRARRPEAAVVLVGDNPPEHPPGGLRVYRKWDDTDGVVAAIEDALERRPV